MTEYKKALNKILTVGEILVDVSKLHLTAEEAIDEIKKLNITGACFKLRELLEEAENELE